MSSPSYKIPATPEKTKLARDVALYFSNKCEARKRRFYAEDVAGAMVGPTFQHADFNNGEPFSFESVHDVVEGYAEARGGCKSLHKLYGAINPAKFGHSTARMRVALQDEGFTVTNWANGPKKAASSKKTKRTDDEKAELGSKNKKAKMADAKE